MHVTWQLEHPRLMLGLTTGTMLLLALLLWNSDREMGRLIEALRWLRRTGVCNPAILDL